MLMPKDLTKTTSSLVCLSSRTKTKERSMLGCQGFDHMKQKCPTYLKTIRKSKALATTLSDTELEDDSDNEDDGILNAFTTTVNPTKGLVEDVDEEDG